MREGNAGSVSVPPRSNTGVPISECVVGIDYFTFSVRKIEPESIKRLLGGIVGNDGGWVEGHGTQFYHFSATGPYGASIAWEPRSDPQNTRHGTVTLKGDWFAAAGVQGAMWLLQHVDGIEDTHVTRVDLRVDVPEGVGPTPQELAEFEAAGIMVTPVRKSALVVSRERGSEHPDGATFSLGARTSARYLRVYNKTAESRGVIHGIRWEFEFKTGWSEAIARALTDSPPSEWGDLFASELRRSVDMRDPESDDNVTRRARLDWWDSFTSTVAVAIARTARPTVALARSAAWLQRCAPTAAAVFEAYGGSIDAVLLWLSDGKRRQGPRHRLMLAEAGLL